MLKCNTLAKWVQQTIELKLMVPVSLSFFFLNIASQKFQVTHVPVTHIVFLLGGLL